MLRWECENSERVWRPSNCRQNEIQTNLLVGLFRRMAVSRGRPLPNVFFCCTALAILGIFSNPPTRHYSLRAEPARGAPGVTGGVGTTLAQNDELSAAANETAPESHWALWVGSVTPYVLERDLVELFSRFGEIKSAVLKSAPEHSPADSIAFINYHSRSAAEAAFKEMNHFMLGGKRLKLRPPKFCNISASPQKSHQLQPQSEAQNPPVPPPGWSPWMFPSFSSNQTMTSSAKSPSENTGKPLGEFSGEEEWKRRVEAAEKRAKEALRAREEARGEIKSLQDRLQEEQAKSKDATDRSQAMVMKELKRSGALVKEASMHRRNASELQRRVEIAQSEAAEARAIIKRLNNQISSLKDNSATAPTSLPNQTPTPTPTPPAVTSSEKNPKEELNDKTLERMKALEGDVKSARRDLETAKADLLVAEKKFEEEKSRLNINLSQIRSHRGELETLLRRAEEERKLAIMKAAEAENRVAETQKLLTDTEARLSKSLAEEQSLARQLRTERHKEHKTLAELKNMQSLHKAEIGRYLEIEEDLRTNLHKAHEDKKSVVAELGEITRSRREGIERNVSLTLENQKLKMHFKDAKEEVVKVRKQLSESVTSYRNQCASLQNQATNMKSMLATLTKNQTQATNKIQSLTLALEQEEKACKQARAGEKEARGEVIRVLKRIEAMEIRHAQQENDKAKLRRESNRLREDGARIKREMKDITAQVTSLLQDIQSQKTNGNPIYPNEDVSEPSGATSPDIRGVYGSKIYDYERGGYAGERVYQRLDAPQDASFIGLRSERPHPGLGLPEEIDASLLVRLRGLPARLGDEQLRRWGQTFGPVASAQAMRNGHGKVVFYDHYDAQQCRAAAQLAGMAGSRVIGRRGGSIASSVAGMANSKPHGVGHRRLEGQATQVSESSGVASSPGHPDTKDRVSI
ncbi:hypothetical protein AAMO2058_000977400 [Amorphochlora amoebiformis]